VDRVTQNKGTIKCDVPTDSGGLYKISMDMVTQNIETEQCNVLPFLGHIAEDSRVHSDTGTTGGTV